MNKSKEQTLYGAKSCKLQAKGFKAAEWSALRAGSDWGFLNDEDGGLIYWFKDPGARDDFQRIFGGIGVTLRRKDEDLTGQRALAFLKNAKEVA